MEALKHSRTDIHLNNLDFYILQSNNEGFLWTVCIMCAARQLCEPAENTDWAVQLITHGDSREVDALHLDQKRGFEVSQPAVYFIFILFLYWFCQSGFGEHVGEGFKTLVLPSSSSCSRWWWPQTSVGREISSISPNIILASVTNKHVGMQWVVLPCTGKLGPDYSMVQGYWSCPS